MKEGELVYKSSMFLIKCSVRDIAIRARGKMIHFSSYYPHLFGAKMSKAFTVWVIFA